MRTRRSPRSGNAVLRLGGGAVLAAMALGSQGGCTREFYREWANQDVSEAVFEKSRDPRWRLDLFSIEPTALSRFADPYDQDAPPAPPDDVATEALSPVPQWPSNRLIVPTEGTGYVELMEYWQRQDLASAANAARREGLDADPEGPRPGCRATWATAASRCRSAPTRRRARASRSSRSRAWPTPSCPAMSSGRPRRSTPTSRPEPRHCRWCPAPAARCRPGPETSAAGMRPGPRGNQWVAAGPRRRLPRLSPGSPSTGPARHRPARPVPARSRPARPGTPRPPRGSRGASTDLRRRASYAPVIPIVRLQDGPETAAAQAAVRSGPIMSRSGVNSGTKAAGSTHISVSRGASKEARPIIPPPRPPAYRVGAQTTGPRGGKDRMLARVAYQDESVSGGSTAVGPDPRPVARRPAQPGARPEAATQPSQLPPPIPGQAGRRPGTLEPTIEQPPGLDSTRERSARSDG